MNIPMYKALLSAGADEKLATEAVQTLPSDPATKADIADLRSEMQASITDLRSEMHTSITNLRSEMHTSIAGLRVWLMWRLMLAMGAQLGLFVAIIKLWN